MPKKPFHIGVYMEEEITCIESDLTDVREAGFDYMCCGILSEESRRNALQGIQKPEEPFSWFDMSLPSTEWYSSVIGVLSDFQEYTESADNIIRDNACETLTKELGYAQHLGFVSTMVNLNPLLPADNLTKLLYSKVTYDETTRSNLTLWVRIPMVVENHALSNGGGDSVTSEEATSSSWKMWHKFRCASAAEKRIFPVLDFPLDLPEDAEINRWLGEQVKAISLSEEVFTTNSKGFPVLPKATQKVLKQFYELGCHFLINCKPAKGPMFYTPYKQYIEYLLTKYNTELDQDVMRKCSKGYEDYLQAPLQPLMDNLEANTYEVFERDPVKYELYQKAIAKALEEKVSEEEKLTKTLVVMVVGAGRGPLVRNSLAAAESVNRQIKVYAVEKNVNAVCTLLHLKKRIWGDQVTVVSCDMREFNPEEKADIIVSELLGSFGDNELSPECLDGAQRFLKDDGIMIPESYTSYISPIMSQKLHSELRAYQDINKHTLSSFETPYVVLMKNFYEIDKPKQLFKFSHPKSSMNESNNRYGSAEFTAELDCMMHGIAGYFDSHLFGGINMSIHPDTHSEGMFSWFQIFFPIKEPINIRKGDVIKIHFWRCSNKHNVWYEWSVSSPIQSPVHNVNGRSYTIGL